METEKEMTRLAQRVHTLQGLKRCDRFEANSKHWTRKRHHQVWFLLDGHPVGRYSMPNKGKISKSQLLDLLLAIYQPPDNEDEDLDATFKEWDRKGNGKIDWDDFLAEVTQRVNDKISCSGPERFADIYRGMLARSRGGKFNGPDVGERAVLRMVWYQYCQNQRNIDKQQLLLLLKAINQPPANEHSDLDETFKEIDTKNDGVIDLDEFMEEITQRVKDGIPA